MFQYLAQIKIIDRVVQGEKQKKNIFKNLRQKYQFKFYTLLE